MLDFSDHHIYNPQLHVIQTKVEEITSAVFILVFGGGGGKGKGQINMHYRNQCVHKNMEWVSCTAYMHCVYKDMHCVYMDMHCVYMDMHCVYMDMHCVYMDMQCA